MTIYEELIARGYTDEQIRGDRRRHASTRGFVVAVADTPDGIPLVGITYACDFRAEEEWGVASIKKALVGEGKNLYTMDKRNTDKVGRFEGLHSLILSTESLAGDGTFSWGHNINRPGEIRNAWDRLAPGSLDVPADQKRNGYSDYEYDVWWEGAVAGQQGVAQDYRLSWKTLPELRAYAKDKGISLTGLRKKDDILRAIKTAPEFAATAETPDNWPAWFHQGKQFIARADRGVAADVLDMLYAAGKRGTLAQGGGQQVFGSGMAFYDGLDVGAKLHKERKAYAKWYAKWEKKLEPVKKTLKARGHGWYALGRPTDMKGEVKYWLNGHGSGPGYNKQPYGWYTLEELLAEKFVTDINAKEK